MHRLGVPRVPLDDDDGQVDRNETYIAEKRKCDATVLLLLDNDVEHLPVRHASKAQRSKVLP